MTRTTAAEPEITRNTSTATTEDTEAIVHARTPIDDTTTIEIEDPYNIALTNTQHDIIETALQGVVTNLKTTTTTPVNQPVGKVTLHQESKNEYTILNIEKHTPKEIPRK